MILVACCGAGVLDYEVTFTACGATLAFGSSCTLKITFSPQSTGEKFGTITFSTNDPVQPELIVTLAGTSSADNDNVNDAIEDSATNGGDGDNDGVADSQQGNVASIRTSDGSTLHYQCLRDPSFKT